MLVAKILEQTFEHVTKLCIYDLSRKGLHNCINLGMWGGAQLIQEANILPGNCLYGNIFLPLFLFVYQIQYLNLPRTLSFQIANGLQELVRINAVQMFLNSGCEAKIAPSLSISSAVNITYSLYASIFRIS